LEFFDSDNFGVDGEVHLQGFFDLMGDPADAIGLNFNGNRMVDSGTLFEDYVYAIVGFGFHGYVVCGIDIESLLDVQ
jgi:hypothetical protein